MGRTEVQAAKGIKRNLPVRKLIEYVGIEHVGGHARWRRCSACRAASSANAFSLSCNAFSLSCAIVFLSSQVFLDRAMARSTAASISARVGARGRRLVLYSAEGFTFAALGVLVLRACSRRASCIFSAVYE